ncbi:uncharacterized protein BT62DRAFT_396051 [Guyanagaster necrorhizus]|uniref:F-box domain-containing protein n=1 Tax=Guyanagaster necrorhizus TaxID=856835 RepID=A0A9P7W2N5_9AGAR|nr:uncharacterized protein BT62DRAFT_396051 [Guyanagaster necrorhizus MCA 3950]KAG7451088.1 hypothetical protein BT62DRAFT_396051 [Guyanagaster necrorhizus MCA 3950]
MECDESREIVLRDTTSRIKELEDQKQRLLQEVNEVDKELQLAHARHKQLLNHSAPISVLPFEVLSSIFMLCSEDAICHRSSFGITASHVSSTWRAVATGTPMLWNRIFINLSIVLKHRNSHFAKKLELLNIHLSRSGECLLNIRLQVNGNYPWPDFLDIMAAHLWRCKELSMSIANNFSPIEDVIKKLRALTAQQLERLSIRIKFHPHHPHLQTQYELVKPRILSGGANYLSFVRLSGVSGPLQPPLGNVTTLHIDGTHMDELHLDQCRAFLGSMAKLINLSLSRMKLKAGLARESTPIHLPNLESLRISGTDELDRSRMLMAQLPLSQIHSLVLKGIDDLGDNQFPNVRSLTLSACSFPSTQLGHTVDAFPSLTSIDCDLAVISVLLILSWTGDEAENDGVPAFWKKVETLSIRDMEPLHIELLIRSITARVKKSGAFRLLRLDHRSRSALRSKNELTRLEKMVNIDKCDYVEAWPSGLEYEDNDDSFWD